MQIGATLPPPVACSNDLETASELQGKKKTESFSDGNFDATEERSSRSDLENYCSLMPFTDSRQGRETEVDLISEEMGLERHNTTPSDDEIQNALQFLEKADEFLKLDSQKDVVLVLGNNASIKSAFAQHIYGYYNMESLRAVETLPAEFVFEEGHDSSHADTSNTFLELLVNTDTETAFCVFPVLSKTRRISEEIVSVYLMKQVLHSSRSVKVILSVSYPSVVKDLNKEDFLTFVTESATLISNITKFKDSIALIVTTEDDTELQDNEIINDVAKFLEDIKRFITEKYQLQDKTSAERPKNESAIQIIDNLLLQNNDDYLKIGLFRGLEAAVKISSDSEGYNVDLQTIIQDYTVYVTQDNDDFHFKLSDELRNKLYLLVNHINEVVLNRTTLLGKDIIQFYRSREEQMGLNNIVKLIHELETGHNILSEMIRNISESPEPKKFSKIIVNVLRTLEVNIAIDNLIDITRQCKYLEFLQIIGGQDFVKVLITEWVSPINNIVNEIRDSKEWFAFLVTTHDALLAVSDPAETASASHRKDTRANGTGFRKLGTEIESYGIPGYENITRSGINDPKLRALRNVLRTTEKEKTKVSCLDGEKISANGTHVKLSEVLELTINKCEKQLKSIEIFASDTVLIDVDLDKAGEQLHVTILAPKWNATGRRRIILSGSEGPRHVPQRAADGGWPGHSGKDGKPGLTGGNAGSYFTIAKEYLEGDIAFYSHGGKGGPGQGGGNGREGSRGDTQRPYSGTRCNIGPRDVRSQYRRIRHERRKWRWNCVCFYDLYVYEFYDWGRPGGRGGNGGRGGLGGRGGEHKNIHLNGSQSWGGFGAEGENGENGEGGKGGKGGLGGVHGDIITAQCTADWYMFFSRYRWQETGRRSNGRGISGRDGIQGENSEYMIQPTARNEFKDSLSSIINRYKVYLISSLDDVINKQPLSEFIILLGSDPQVQSTYDTLAFVDELRNLETQFYKQSIDVDFLPFYQSLLQRISSYAENPRPHESSEEYKKVLTYLYTATLSKTHALNETSSRNLVTNIEGYLDLTIEYIQEIKEINRLDAIDATNNDYKGKINEKITSANDFIMKEILPEIEVIGSLSERTVDELIAEVIEMQQSAKEGEKELREKQKELGDSLGQRIASGVLSFVSGALSLLSPVGSAAVRLTEQACLVSKGLSLGGQTRESVSVQLPEEISSALQHQLDTVQSATYKTVAALRHQVATLLQAMKSSPMRLQDMRGTVKDIEGRLDNIGKYDLKKARKLQDELIQEITRKEEELKKFHGSRVTRDFRVTRFTIPDIILGTFKVLGKVAKMSADIYMKYKDDKNALEEIGEAIEKAQDKFDELKQYEDKIQNSVLPMMRAVQSEMLRVQDGLVSKSEVALQVTRWRIQSTLKDIKLLLRQFTNGFKVQDNLSRCVDKLDETMTTLIDIYDRIQSYTQQKELADYIADITSANSLDIQVTDKKLRNSIVTLKKTILSNTVFGYYERVVAAFKQWVFPFAERWLQEFKLSSYHKEDDSYENFVPVITGQIQTLKSKLTEYRASIIKGVHSYIHTADFDSSYKSGRPFYTWDNQRYKDSILDLLAGKEVVLKADVFNGVKKNAVKFNTIEIHFKAANKTVQEEMNALLNYFHVTLTHHGNSYYRCGTRFYVIRGDNQTIEYSGEKRGNGEPMDYNSVYRKLKDGDLMLSPYAMWSIRLVNVTDVNFSELVNFGHHVDLELKGRGQYVAQNADVCNHDLKTFYETEDSISEYDSVM